MSARRQRPGGKVALIELIPNMLTIAGICAGLTAIRLGVNGNYASAVQLIMLACVLDGLDGRIARLLRSDSKLGAELDSLGDFLNFGVAPPLVLYFWALQDLRGLGWMAVLIYAICCVVRLARFNISDKADAEAGLVKSRAYFVGVPSPAGAFLALMPMFVAFAFPAAPILPDGIIIANLILVGLAMISTIPTLSFKTTRVSRANVKYYLVGFAVLGAGVLTHFWFVMIALCTTYVGVVLWGLATRGKDAGQGDG